MICSARLFLQKFRKIFLNISCIKKKRGFTVIELIVVLGILSVLLYTFTQVLGNIQRKIYSTTTRLDLNNYLVLSRSKAVSLSETLVLVVSLEEKKMGLKKLPATWQNKNLDMSAVVSKNYWLEGDWLLKQIPLPADFEAVYSVSGQKIETPYFYVMFYRDGKSDSLLWQTSRGGLFLSSVPNSNQVLTKDFFQDLSLP